MGERDGPGTPTRGDRRPFLDGKGDVGSGCTLPHPHPRGGRTHFGCLRPSLSPEGLNSFVCFLSNSLSPAVLGGPAA